jgi:hypothetical protein
MDAFIGFGFDDSERGSLAPSKPHQLLAEERASDLRGGAFKERKR